MSDMDRVVGILSESRMSLERSFSALRPLALQDPRQFHDFYRIWARLMGDQVALERSIGINTSGQLGAFWIPIIVGGGMALTAIATWAWKHHEETTSYEKYLECVDRYTKAGMSPGEAASVCRGQEEGIMPGLEKAMNIGLILSLIVAGVWVFSKLK